MKCPIVTVDRSKAVAAVARWTLQLLPVDPPTCISGTEESVALN